MELTSWGLLDRLAHSRVVARHSRSEPVGRLVEQPADGYLHERTCWSLKPSADRPQVLVGALDRLAIPDAPCLAHALEQLGVGCGPGAPVFLDTETTGLGDAIPFMVGLASIDGGALWVEQWTLARRDAEQAMLRSVFDRLDRLAPAPLITFNGASFDLPLLARRADRHSLSRRVGLASAHLDILHVARRLASRSGLDCRLATLEREHLGVVRGEDLPSHEIPWVFESWLRDPSDPIAAARLRAVQIHNQADLVTLPALVVELSERVAAPADLTTAMQAAGLLIKHGHPARARAMLEPWIDRTGSHHSIWRQAVLRVAELARRSGDLDGAVAAWQRLLAIDPSDASACEGLAKHLEHRKGELSAALEVARASRAGDPHRIQRLEGKLSERGPPAAEISTGVPTAPVQCPPSESVALRFAPWRRGSALLVEPRDTAAEPRPTYRLFTR